MDGDELEAYLVIVCSKHPPTLGNGDWEFNGFDAMMGSKCLGFDICYEKRLLVEFG